MRNKSNQHVEHLPLFRWCDNVIYDGKAPIARFRQHGGHDLALREVVLRPGGKPLIWSLGPLEWEGDRITGGKRIESRSELGDFDL